MTYDFAAKYIWACALTFICSLNGEIFLFKIVKINLTDSRRKKSPQLLDQSKHIFLALTAKSFPSVHIRDGCKQFQRYKCICRCSFNFTAITAAQPISFTMTKFLHQNCKFRPILTELCCFHNFSQKQ